MTRRGAFRSAAICAALLPVAACGGAEQDSARSGADADVVESRPASGEDTLWLEGMPEPVTLELYRAPPSFPLGFSTYLPADMAAETIEEGGGAGVRFVAEFGGFRNPDAYLHVYVHPAGTPATKAQDEALAFRTSRGIPVSRGLLEMRPEGTPDFPWAFRSYGFLYQERGGWYQGWLALGRHDERIFQLVSHYPAEYGDGFEPRARLILERWRWEDTGAGLGGPGTPAVPPRAGPGTRD